jgi:hypothetical protein
MVCRSSLPSVPLFPASQLIRTAGPDSLETEFCDIPCLVRVISTGQEFFFQCSQDTRQDPTAHKKLNKEI